ncbi:MAG: type IV toxin-antitoxin system AbiEi family antitoxin domain-containing protein [Sedimentisphaerales bacterium]|nr:type IV toxin-antitoxin system AbiEi family antitoxin domain-containing protein [Sedimentisphaerales bacterium]
MKYTDLLAKVSDLPVFTVSFLAAGQNLPQIRLQISRWVKSGKIIRLHKGLYTLAEPYRKVSCEPFTIANRLKQPSYVSLHSALSWYGMIPEFVPVVTNITTARPQNVETPLGRFEFRHISKKYFWGYQQVELKFRQTVFIARPEKALLDLIYLTPGGDEIEFIKELRLQNFERINQKTLSEFVQRFKLPKLSRARNNIEKVLHQGEGIEL